MNTSFRALLLSTFLMASFGANPQGMGKGMGPENREDMAKIHQLLGNHNKVTRKVTKLENGVETLTESADAKVAETIKAHAFAMQKRMKEGRPIRQWDPLFAELFNNHAKISISVTKTKNGVKVTETSSDPYAVTLIQWHAESVSGFVKEGMAGMHKEHPAPPKTASTGATSFIGMGDGVKTCPVTGEPIDQQVSTVIQGKTVYFCCAGCIEKVRKEPKRYLKWAK